MKTENGLSLFLSNEYREYTQRQAEDMVYGVCSYLRSLGFDFSEKDERERANLIVSVINTNPDITAFTDSKSIVINAGSEILNVFKNDETLLHYAIQGFRVHEMGHVLFTDFTELRKWVNLFDEKKWYPQTPKTNITDFELLLSKPTQRKFFIEIAKCIQNVLEDAYIENELNVLYPGIAKTQLATLNDAIITYRPADDEFLSLDDDFFSFQRNLLMYANFGIEPQIDSFPSLAFEVFEKCKPFVLKTISSRNPKKRLEYCNEILCIAFPLYKKFFDEKSCENKSKESGSKSEGQGSEGQSSEGQGSEGQGSEGQSSEGQGSEGQSSEGQGSEGQGSKGGDISDELKEKILSEIIKENSKNSTQSTSKSIFSNKDLGEFEEIKNDFDVSDLAKDEDDKNTNYEIEKIKEEIKHNNELADKEKELTLQLNSKCPLTVQREVHIPFDLKIKYNNLSKGLLSVSRGVERVFKNLIKSDEDDGVFTGLPMGSKFEARHLYRNDGKYFSRKNAPIDECRLAIGLLCDESGSMNQDMIEASIKTGIIIEDLCKRLDLPCIIGGYTSGTYFSYVEPNSVDQNDKYRLCSMNSRNGTPTGKVMEYMVSRLNNLDANKKLLIVSTDGCSEEGKDCIHQVIQEAKKKKIMVIGAGIGQSRYKVEEEFQDNFLDVSDVQKLPGLLTSIIKRNLF